MIDMVTFFFNSRYSASDDAHQNTKQLRLLIDAVKQACHKTTHKTLGKYKYIWVRH